MINGELRARGATHAYLLDVFASLEQRLLVLDVVGALPCFDLFAQSLQLFDLLLQLRFIFLFLILICCRLHLNARYKYELNKRTRHKMMNMNHHCCVKTIKMKTISSNLLFATRRQKLPHLRLLFSESCQSRLEKYKYNLTKKSNY